MAAAEVDDILELTPLQHGMLFHTLAEPDARLYFEQVCLYLPMPIEPEPFRQAWQAVVDRHQALRAGLHWAKLDKPVQVIHRRAPLHVHLEDWSGMPAAEQLQRLQTYLQADRAQGLALQQAPLMHVALFRLGAAAHEFVCSFHHAILDGWSLNLVFAEFLESYRALTTRTPAQLPPPVPYRHYIAWLQQQGHAAAESHWRATLSGSTGTTGWAPQAAVARRPDPARQYGSAERRLAAPLAQALDGLARQARATLNAVLQAAWAVLLGHCSHSDDVVFGAIVSGRPPDLDGVERIVGLFINTVPVRARIDDLTTSLALVQALHAQGLAARQHSHCALTDVVRWSGLPPGRELFDSLLIFENLPGAGKAAPQVRATAIERTNYPFTLVVAPGREIALKALFIAPPLALPVVERLLEQLEQLLAAMAASPQRPLRRLAWLPAAQRAALLAPAPAAPPPAAPRLERVFERQATANPDRCALIDAEQRLSAGELRAAAAALAQRLGPVDGGGTELVALLLPPGAALVAAMLGVLMSGRAFLLLDPAYPVERLRFMVEDSRAAALVADPALTLPVPAGVRHVGWTWDAAAAPAAPVPAAQPGPATAPPPAADGLAYVIYTSGSTGRPKGVMQTHGATLARFGWMWRSLPFAADAVGCHRTALGFVDVVWEVLGPVLAGVPLVIVPEAARRDPLALAQLLLRERVSRLLLVPSLLRALVELPAPERAGLACVREWICSGEALGAELAALWREAFPASRLFNLYGSSEVAGDVSWAEAGDTPGPDVPIGVAMDGCEVLVLDDELQPLPWGVVGEVYVGGAHLALGYLGQPALTAQRFVPHPHAGQAGARLYRTGDLARRLEDGALVYQGRVDAQIKLRGMRLEPGEIEAALRAQPGVRQAVVLEQAGQLVALLTALPGAHPSPGLLRQGLEASLPAHLLPSRIVTLPQLPLQPNGKVDRRALRHALADLPAEPRRERPPASTPTERRLAQIWQELLQVQAVAADDDFLSLGGHSITAMQLVSRVLKHTGQELPIGLIFERRSLRELAGVIDGLAAKPATAAQGLVRLPRASRQLQPPPGA